MIDEILVENGKVVGVRTATHQEYGAKAVVSLLGCTRKLSLETSNCLVNHSLASYQFGRCLKQLGLEIGRFKNNRHAPCKGIVN